MKPRQEDVKVCHHVVKLRQDDPMVQLETLKVCHHGTNVRHHVVNPDVRVLLLRPQDIVMPHDRVIS